MPIQAYGWHMAVESRESALFVSFGCERGPPNEAVNAAIADKLFELAGRMAGRTLFLNLAEVSFLTSGMIGKLVGLHKRLRAIGGHLTLFGLQAPVREQFSRTRLDRLLDLRAEQPLDGPFVSLAPS